MNNARARQSSFTGRSNCNKNYIDNWKCDGPIEMASLILKTTKPVLC